MSIERISKYEASDFLETQNLPLLGRTYVVWSANGGIHVTNPFPGEERDFAEMVNGHVFEQRLTAHYVHVEPPKEP